jgi:Xaa-Pro aminopeptidase
MGPAEMPMHEAPYRAFSLAEYRDRVRRAFDLLDARRLDCLGLVGLESLHYFAGYDSYIGVVSPQMLILSREAAPVLVVRDADEAVARESGWVADIRIYHVGRDDPILIIAESLRDIVGDAARIGVDAESRALHFAYGRALEAALPGSDFIDVSRAVGDLRAVKSAAELAYIRRAAAMANAGLETARRVIRAGVTERFVAAEVEYTVRVAGSDYWAIPMNMASGSRSPGGHGTPRNKVIEPGDVVHIEFAGVEERYHAVAMQTVVAGGPPPQRVRDIYAVALEALRAGQAAIRPGALGADVEEAALGPIERFGLGDGLMMRFGYGVGVGYPPNWLETLEMVRTTHQELHPGMVFVLHVALQPPGEPIGVVVGGTYCLTTGGLELLAGAGDVELASLP